MPNPSIALLLGIGLMACIYGLLRFYPTWRHGRELTARVQREDALKHIHKFEMDRQQPTVHSVAGILNLGMDSTAELLAGMERDNLLEIEKGKIQLTSGGRDSALHIIRAHRLWERYLAEETGYAAADWHSQAERHEHLLTPEQANSLAARLGNPIFDPHGDPIPTADGKMPDRKGVPITDLNENDYAEIIHLEDEPVEVYKELIKSGLYLGMHLRIKNITDKSIRIEANGKELEIKVEYGRNISVATVSVEKQLDRNVRSLSSLKVGESGKIVGISSAIRGKQRRRLLDFGIVPGTVITPRLVSLTGDPVAYNIRGASIALRKEQTDMILVEDEGKGKE